MKENATHLTNVSLYKLARNYGETLQMSTNVFKSSFLIYLPTQPTNQPYTHPAILLPMPFYEPVRYRSGGLEWNPLCSWAHPVNGAAIKFALERCIGCQCIVVVVVLRGRP